VASFLALLVRRLALLSTCVGSTYIKVPVVTCGTGSAQAGSW
jgi:hypothetical protein